jgi:hypothetical protein
MKELSFEQRIDSPEKIETILRTFGVGYVVTEDTAAYPPGPLTWLQDAVKTDRFELRRRIPIASRDRRLQGVTLAVYAYKGRTPADPDAVLDMHIPLIGRNIGVRVADLVGQVQTR